MDTGIITTAFSMGTTSIPLVLVWLVGIVLALIFWRRHPQVSLAALIALVGFLTISLLDTALRIWLIQRQGISKFAEIAPFLSIFFSLARAALWGLILVAIFGWRKEAQ